MGGQTPGDGGTNFFLDALTMGFIGNYYKLRGLRSLT
jgi:hypothetical protein